MPTSPTVIFDVESLLLGISPFVLQAYRIHVPAKVLALPGGSVTLIAHEIAFDDGAVLDVSGEAGQAMVIANSGQTPGADGDTGIKGNKGQDGGSISIYASVITGSATLKANGGNGGPGQNGGNGANGQDGNTECNGLNGGASGVGGEGGDAGWPGSISVSVVDSSQANLTPLLQPGDPGQPGVPGTPGRGGAAGQVVTTYIYPPPGRAGVPMPPTPVPGNPTAKGDDGYVRGNPGKLGGQPPAGTPSLSQADRASFVATILPMLDSSYWAVLLQECTSQYLNNDFSDAANICNWINTIGSNGKPDVDTALDRSRGLSSQLLSGMDFYGHPKNYAQALSVGAYEASNASLIADGILLEKALDSYQQQRQAQITRMSALNTSIQQAQSQITSNTTDRANLISQGTSLTAQLQELLTQETAALNNVNSTAANLQAALAAGQGCSFSEIMSAASLVVTFAAGLPAVEKTIASTASQIGDQLSQPPTMAGLQSIVKNIQTIGNTVGGNVSQITQIVTAYQNLKQSRGGLIPAPGDDDTKFLVSDQDFASIRQNFEKQISQLPPSSQKDAYDDAVNHYLNLVQIRNQQLLSFNGLSFRVANLDSSTSNLQSSITSLNGQILAAQAADISGLLDELTALRDGLLQSVYFELLQHSRALDYWTLTPVDLPYVYQDFGALSGILATLIQRKTAALQQLANPPATFKTGQPVVIPLDANQVASLQNTGVLFFTLTPDMAVFASLTQVLLSGITVEFGAADGSNIVPSSYSLEHSGYHKFVGVNGTDIYEFLTPPRTILFAQGQMNISNSFTGPDNSLDSSPQGASLYVGVSPFTRWKLDLTAAPAALAAVANVTELRIGLSGSARP
jgi:hypothetical protein